MEEDPEGGGGPCLGAGDSNKDKAGPCPLGEAAAPTEEEEGVAAAESGITSIPRVVRTFF